MQELVDYVCNESSWINISSVISALIGGLVGAGGAIWAVHETNKLNRKNDVIKEKKEIKATIQAIKDEIETLKVIYMQSVGNQLEEHESGTPFNYYFVVTQEYFTVYSNNANKIGMIENDILRKSIVETYSKARSLIDTYNTNNDIFRTYDQNNWLFNITNNEVFRQEADYNMERLAEYSNGLKRKHDEFIQAVDLMLANIDNNDS